MINLNISLPKGLLKELKNSPRVVVREDCEVAVVDLGNSVEGTDIFLNFLKVNEGEVDPLLNPTFGHPLYPYIQPIIQVEVCNLLATFQPLVAADFRQGVIVPLIAANLPFFGGGVQYHHSKIAIHALYMEISQPVRFAANCPGIAALLPGQIICDLNIIFANTIIVLRLRKF